MISSKTYTGMITSLEPNQIFVFGSNCGSSSGGKPTHGAGAALMAKKRFGAIQGKSRGRQGQSYAIVTKKYWDRPKSSTLDEIFDEIVSLYQYARNNPDLHFMVAQASTRGLNGYEPTQLAELFLKAVPPDNIYFEESFNELV